MFETVLNTLVPASQKLPNLINSWNCLLKVRPKEESLEDITGNMMEMHQKEKSVNSRPGKLASNRQRATSWHDPGFSQPVF